jgi:isoleucyl-tRNA synthetase
LIVSQVSDSRHPGAAASMAYDSDVLQCEILVSKADGAKCERCWKYDPQVGQDEKHQTVCARCARVLNAGDTA